MLDITNETSVGKLEAPHDIAERLSNSITNARKLRILLGLKLLPDGSFRTVNGETMTKIPGSDSINVGNTSECIPFCNIVFTYEVSSGKTELSQEYRNATYERFICEKPVFDMEAAKIVLKRENRLKKHIGVATKVIHLVNLLCLLLWATLNYVLHRRR